MEGPTLYHYTCEHAYGEIGPHGWLRPWSHGLVWLTDLDTPMREPLGLTSYMLHCDRTEHRYRVTDTATCVRWVDHPRRDREIELPGTMPMHWWVSDDPVPVVHDPLLPGVPRTMDKLLTPAERTRMRRDFAEIADKRRRAEAEAGSWRMP